MKYEKIIKALIHNGYKVSYFENSNEAAKYIVDNVKNTTVGFGDSATLESINLAELLSKNNTVIDPAPYSGDEFNEVAKKALLTDVFFTSVNGVAETGELVNIDGTGNRVAGSLFGHKKFTLFSEQINRTYLRKAIGVRETLLLLKIQNVWVITLRVRQRLTAAMIVQVPKEYATL